MHVTEPLLQSAENGLEDGRSILDDSSTCTSQHHTTPSALTDPAPPILYGPATFHLHHQKSNDKNPLGIRLRKTHRPSRIRRSRIEALQLVVFGLISTAVSWALLALVTAIAIFHTWRRQQQQQQQSQMQSEPEEDETCPHEIITQDEAYYVKRWGYQCESYEVVTPDGYIIHMHRVSKKGMDDSRHQADGSPLPPVLLGHGLFQCSGDFVLNEENSLAFALVEQGYDVWMGNTRATSTLDHVSLSHKDPEYWAWGLKELSLHDLVCALDFVGKQTGFNKVAYIGHSQGNAQAFIALKLRPEVAAKFSCFIALAPAVFSGTLVSKFPLKQLIGMNQRMYRLIFGTSGFLPIMSIAQKLCNPAIFSQLAYSMFSYLFAWWDTHWLSRRKVKYFQFTPRPVSAQLIADWLEGWGKQGVCKYVTEPMCFSTDNDEAAASKTRNKIPFAAFYGTEDFLVDGDCFIATFDDEDQCIMDGCRTSHLFPMLNLVHVGRIPGYEHMDTIWAHDNHVTTYPGIFKVLSLANWQD